MSETDKQRVIFILSALVGIGFITEFRLRRLRKEFNALRVDFLGHLEDEFQDAVDDAFEEITEHYDDGY